MAKQRSLLETSRREFIATNLGVGGLLVASLFTITSITGSFSSANKSSADVIPPSESSVSPNTTISSMNSGPVTIASSTTIAETKTGPSQVKFVNGFAYLNGTVVKVGQNLPVKINSLTLGDINGACLFIPLDYDAVSESMVTEQDRFNFWLATSKKRIPADLNSSSDFQLGWYGAAPTDEDMLNTWNLISTSSDQRINWLKQPPVKGTGQVVDFPACYYNVDGFNMAA